MPVVATEGSELISCGEVESFKFLESDEHFSFRPLLGDDSGLINTSCLILFNGEMNLG